jgi:acyl-CoA synthetase (NDP forming)/GNAT superfamily N-acetyltransferase
VTEVAESGRSYALLADGTTMTIRPATAGDYDAVLRLHETMSPDNLYFRFFSASRVSAEREARRVCLDDRPGLVALLGLRGDDLAGVASYELTGDPAAAEVALAVADGLHRRGIATLLLEHLVSLARARGVRTLMADVLPDNYPMLHVIADSGLAVRRRIGGGVVEIAMPVPATAALGEASTYLDAVADRGKHADVASLAPLLAPRSVAVVGPGQAIPRGIRDAGFPGALYACADVADLPEAPDLAVLTVPARQVVEVARACGQRGVKSLAVITSGLTPEQESGLLAAARQGGMRLIGPDSSGVAAPGIGLDATSGMRHLSPGRAGIAVQSGGLGAALAEQFSRLGIGISSFVSVGDMLDVSATDMLLWWEADESTELAVLYLESFGNARQFARTARRVSTLLPVLTVHGGHSAPGQRAAASHTAAAVAPLITRQALFEQAGIIATTSFGELLDAAALVASQPIPGGNVVAVVSNSGGAAVLTADACAEAGLTVAPASPVNATAAAGAEAFGAALRNAAEGADAVIAVVVRSARPDLIPAITGAQLPVPVAAVVFDQPEAVRLLPGDGSAVPAYASPEAAAGALARAARYGSWRGRPPSTVPDFGDLRTKDALSVVDSFLARMPGGGWLSAEEADELLRCYGIPMVPFIRAADTDAAADAASRFDGHVAVKADVPGLLHKSAAGAVELDLRGPGQVRAAMSRLQATFAGRLAGVLVEPMITGGVETIIGVVQEPVFGPVVVFGLGGVATDVLGERTARLAPLTVADADDLVRPELPGADGLRDVLLRVSRLADDLPQVAELDLNPVIARPDGVVAVDARIRVTSRSPADPFLRQLPR